MKCSKLRIHNPQSKAVSLLVLFVSLCFAQQPQEPKSTTRYTDQFAGELRPKAEAGDSEAMLGLGFIYFYGTDNIQSDLVAAFKWYKKSAEADNVEAMYLLGVCYAEAVGVRQDIGLAIHWLTKAANTGNSDAMRMLGDIYSNGKDIDYVAARKWYELAAEVGDQVAMFNFAELYAKGLGVSKNPEKAFLWYKKAADKGESTAMFKLGQCYSSGRGVSKDGDKAMDWFRNAAQAGNTDAMSAIGLAYYNGNHGIQQDYTSAFKCFEKAALLGNSKAMGLLGVCIEKGQGTAQNYIEAYAWYNCAVAQGNERTRIIRDNITKRMTQSMIQAGQLRSKQILDQQQEVPNKDERKRTLNEPRKLTSGTGFFVTTNGCLITAAHNVLQSTAVRIATGGKTIPVRVVSIDGKNDIALLKAEGDFSALSLVPSRAVKLGGDVFTLGFPNVDLQGISPKLTKGVVSGLNGMQDDPSCFQISVAVQPGNSGGPLINTDGCVVGVINARLNDLATAKLTGSLPQNVNYAVKSAYVLPLLESIPEGSHLQTTPKAMTFEEAVKLAESATCIILAQ